jgi:hypothetical protein
MDFETWMKENFDEPEWYEGYTRADMQKAYEANYITSEKIPCNNCQGQECPVCCGYGYFEIVT